MWLLLILLKDNSPNACLIKEIKKHEDEIRQMNRLYVLPIFIRNYTQKLKTSSECSLLKLTLWLKANSILLSTQNSELKEDCYLTYLWINPGLLKWVICSNVSVFCVPRKNSDVYIVIHAIIHMFITQIILKLYLFQRCISKWVTVDYMLFSLK